MSKIQAIPAITELLETTECERALRISRSTRIRLENTDPEFPRSVKLGPKKRVYVRAEVEAYLQKRLAARNAEAA